MAEMSGAVEKMKRVEWDIERENRGENATFFFFKEGDGHEK